MAGSECMVNLAYRLKGNKKSDLLSLHPFLSIIFLCTSCPLSFSFLSFPLNLEPSNYPLLYFFFLCTLLTLCRPIFSVLISVSISFPFSIFSFSIYLSVSSSYCLLVSFSFFYIILHISFQVCFPCVFFFYYSLP